MAFHGEMNRAYADSLQPSISHLHFCRAAEWLIGAVKLPIRRELLGCTKVKDPIAWGAVCLAGDVGSHEECK